MIMADTGTPKPNPTPHPRLKSPMSHCQVGPTLLRCVTGRWGQRAPSLSRCGAARCQRQRGQRAATEQKGRGVCLLCLRGVGLGDVADVWGRVVGLEGWGLGVSGGWVMDWCVWEVGWGLWGGSHAYRSWGL